MATFFSGTDISTLQSEGNDRNTFVSLIVNNAGDYSAAITRKVTADVKTEVTGSFTLWDDSSPTLLKSDGTERQEIIQYFMLDIQKENSSSPYQDIDRRFEEIAKRKEQQCQKERQALTQASSLDPILSKQRPKYEEPYLFDKEELSGPDDVSVNPAAVQDAVAKMLLCSLVVNPQKIDLHKWVSDRMVPACSKSFGSPDSQKFNEWVDWIVQYSIDFFEDKDLAGLYPNTSDEYSLIVAKALFRELMTYTGNPYLKKYLDSLYSYISVYEQ